MPDLKDRLVFFRYFLAWFGMMALADVNGGIRDKVYKPHVGDLPAHQISTIILLTLFVAYFRLLVSQWPIRSSSQAWEIGATWLLMTLIFEFGVGHFISHIPWERMLQEYNVSAGRIWILIPTWVLIGPYILFRLTLLR